MRTGFILGIVVVIAIGWGFLGKQDLGDFKPVIMPTPGIITEGKTEPISGDLYSCKVDSDCIIPKDQCSCSEKSINKNYLQEWQKDNPKGQYCTLVKCMEPKAICANNKCIAETK